MNPRQRSETLDVLLIDVLLNIKSGVDESSSEVGNLSLLPTYNLSVPRSGVDESSSEVGNKP